MEYLKIWHIFENQLIRNLASKDILRLWHPEGKVGVKGIKVEVASILEAEEKEYMESFIEIEGE